MQNEIDPALIPHSLGVGTIAGQCLGLLDGNVNQNCSRAQDDEWRSRNTALPRDVSRALVSGELAGFCALDPYDL